MAGCWAEFMADMQWSRMKDKTTAQHGALVGRIESRVLQFTPYADATI